METWAEEMEMLRSTASFFQSSNVLDIHFLDGSTYEVYLAISPQERQKGLSEVAWIDLDGMLFVYSQPSYTPFTMAKMQMDLDIGWYASDGALIKKGTYKAGLREPLYCPQPFSYVLEVPAGTLTDSNLKVRN